MDFISRGKGTLVSFTRRSVRAVGIVAALGAAIATMAVDTAAEAAPLAQLQVGFVSSNITDTGSTGCTASQGPSAPSPVVLVANAPVTKRSFTASGTVAKTSPADPTDTTSVSAPITGTARLTSAAGYPKTLDVTYAGSAKSTNGVGHATSGCNAGAESIFGVEGTVTLPRAGRVTATASVAGSGALQLGIISPDGVGPFGGANMIMLSRPNSTASSTTFLPAGTYMIVGAGGVELPAANTARTVTSSGSFHMTFTPGGSRVSGPAGAARNFVALGAGRACVKHALISHVTGPRFAKQIRSVSVFGNGKLLKRVVAPKAGAVITSPMPDAKAENVRAVVVLKNGRRLIETASYLQCS